MQNATHPTPRGAGCSRRKIKFGHCRGCGKRQRPRTHHQPAHRPKPRPNRGGSGVGRWQGGKSWEATQAGQGRGDERRRKTTIREVWPHKVVSSYLPVAHHYGLWVAKSEGTTYGFGRKTRQPVSGQESGKFPRRRHAGCGLPSRTGVPANFSGNDPPEWGPSRPRAPAAIARGRSPHQTFGHRPKSFLPGKPHRDAPPAPAAPAREHHLTGRATPAKTSAPHRGDRRDDPPTGRGTAAVPRHPRGEGRTPTAVGLSDGGTSLRGLPVFRRARRERSPCDRPVALRARAVRGRRRGTCPACP